MIRPSVRKNRLALERNVTGTNPYTWVSVVGDLPVTIPPTATWNPAVGVFFYRALRGHNPALANVDQTDADKRAEWG